MAMTCTPHNHPGRTAPQRQELETGAVAGHDGWAAPADRHGALMTLPATLARRRQRALALVAEVEAWREAQDVTVRYTITRVPIEAPTRALLPGPIRDLGDLPDNRPQTPNGTVSTGRASPS